MKLMAKIILALWIALLGVAPAQSAAFDVPGSHIGHILNAGYDATNQTSSVYDGAR
jgi:hypothetical protein